MSTGLHTCNRDTDPGNPSIRKFQDFMFQRFHVEMVNFVQDIEFSDGIKPKLEIKEELIDVKSTSNQN